MHDNKLSEAPGLKTHQLQISNKGESDMDVSSVTNTSEAN